jgi:hypothetical protein
MLKINHNAILNRVWLLSLFSICGLYLFCGQKHAAKKTHPSSKDAILFATREIVIYEIDGNNLQPPVSGSESIDLLPGPHTVKIENSEKGKYGRATYKYKTDVNFHAKSSQLYAVIKKSTSSGIREHSVINVSDDREFIALAKLKYPQFLTKAHHRCILQNGESFEGLVRASRTDLLYMIKDMTLYKIEWNTVKAIFDETDRNITSEIRNKSDWREIDYKKYKEVIELK